LMIAFLVIMPFVSLKGWPQGRLSEENQLGEAVLSTRKTSRKADSGGNRSVPQQDRKRVRDCCFAA
jgi:hypothetical protein